MKSVIKVHLIVWRKINWIQRKYQLHFHNRYKTKRWQNNVMYMHVTERTFTPPPPPGVILQSKGRVRIMHASRVKIRSRKWLCKIRCCCTQVHNATIGRVVWIYHFIMVYVFNRPKSEESWVWLKNILLVTIEHYITVFGIIRQYELLK